MNTKIKTSMFLALLVFPMLSQAQGQCVKNEKGYQNISGEYVCAIYCPSEGLGGTTYVTQDGSKVKFVNGGGDVAEGTMTSTSTSFKIDIPSWGTSTTLLNNCQELVFGNTSVWLRK